MSKDTLYSNKFQMIKISYFVNTIFEQFLKTTKKFFFLFFGFKLKLEKLRGKTTVRVVFFYKFDLFLMSLELLKSNPIKCLQYV